MHTYFCILNLRWYITRHFCVLFAAVLLFKMIFYFIFVFLRFDIRFDLPINKL